MARPEKEVGSKVLRGGIIADGLGGFYEKGFVLVGIAEETIKVLRARGLVE